MAAAEQKKATVKKTEVEEVEPVKAEESVGLDLDDMLDEIDDVLEENAEEFVKSYIQKGGQ